MNTSHSELDTQSTIKVQRHDDESAITTATPTPALTPEEAFANAMEFITSLKESGTNAKTPLLDTIRGVGPSQSPRRIGGTAAPPVRNIESPRRIPPTASIQELEAESGRIIAQSASFRKILTRSKSTPGNVPRYDSKASAVAAAVKQLPGWSLPDLTDPLLTEALVEALCVKDDSGAWIPDGGVIKSVRKRATKEIKEVVSVHFNDLTRQEETIRNDYFFDENVAFDKIRSLEMREKAVSWSASVRNELNKRKPSTAQATPINPDDLSQWLVGKGMSPVEANFFVSTSLPSNSTPIHIPSAATVDVPAAQPTVGICRIPAPAEVLFGCENPLQSPIRSDTFSQPVQQLSSSSNWRRVEEEVDGMILVHWVRD